MSSERTPRPTLLGRIAELWLTWLKGQFLISCIMGGMTWAAGSAIGLPFAGVLGALAGVMESVPQIGPVVAIVPAAAVALWKGSTEIPVENWVFALIVVGAYLLLQQISNWVIQPRIMGKRLSLPTLAVLGAVLVGGVVGGIVGTLLAVPVLATLWEVAATLQGHRRSP